MTDGTTTDTVLSDDDRMTMPDLGTVTRYLHGTGWALADEDSRTTLWRFRAEQAPDSDLQVVLPVRQEVGDYAERIIAALRAIAYAERRSLEEVAVDMSFGGADTVAVRLTPDAPSGEAPLSLVHSVVGALHSFVVASAAALEIHELVLPPHRPAWAESYANRVQLSTHPGSFVLNLALPLMADSADEGPPSETHSDQVTGDLPPQPFGRRVSNRMLSSARMAQQLAEEVSSGARPLRAFGEDPVHSLVNATELAALKTLGGPEFNVYQLRFAQSPLAGHTSGPVTLRVTPGQQRILGEASDFLRARQPRAGVTVSGFVVRLYRRSGAIGPGQASIEGVDDDSGTKRRYRVELGEGDYNNAVWAHRDGLQVSVTGDRIERGTHLHLRNLTRFSVIPGTDYEDPPDALTDIVSTNTDPED
jgi:hypothetical protein